MKLNVQDFGALGTGIDSLAVDKPAFVAAFNLIKAAGGGELYVPKSPSFYAFDGDGLLCPPNLKMYSDTNATEIRHVNPNNASFFEGTLFYLNTYGSTAVMSSTVPKFALGSIVPKGRNYVKPAIPSGVKVGEVILLAGNIQQVPGTGQTYFAQGEINQVAYTQAHRVYLKYPTSVSLNVNPVLVRINNGTSSTSNIHDENGHQVKDILTNGVEIHDLKLTQADHDEVNDLPLGDNIVLRCPIMGGGFECLLYNLHIEGAGFLPSGNMYGRCVINNITGIGGQKLYDAGYNTHNCTFSNITATIGLDPDKTNSLISNNQGVHDINITGVTVDGTWEGDSVLHFNFANNILIEDFQISLPSFISQYLIKTTPNSKNIYVNNGTIAVADFTTLANDNNGISNIEIDSASIMASATS